MRASSRFSLGPSLGLSAVVVAVSALVVVKIVAENFYFIKACIYKIRFYHFQYHINQIDHNLGKNYIT